MDGNGGGAGWSLWTYQSFGSPVQRAPSLPYVSCADLYPVIRED